MNAFLDKNNSDELVDYMLSDKNGRAYINNFKIINLNMLNVIGVIIMVVI